MVHLRRHVKEDTQLRPPLVRVRVRVRARVRVRVRVRPHEAEDEADGARAAARLVTGGGLR